MSVPNQRKEKQQQPNNASNKKGAAQTASKQKSKQQSKGQANDDVKREQKLQAIILADSFSKSFRPITMENPKVLLPLVNVPMLDYTIEFLSQNGVEEVFVFCVCHAEKVEAYLRQSRWNDLLSINCITSNTCTSAGDALREIDALNVIRSDPFVLISGDVVANINLQRAIAYHKQKRAEDSNNIMTLTLKKVQKTAGIKPLTDDLVIAMNKKTSQLVLFDNNICRNKVSLPIQLMTGTELSFSAEYLDCHVDICSPELILQFSDNFDYRNIRKDFIHNEVCNFALGKHIYGYLLQGSEYAARVQDPRSYHAISRDLVTRWVFPFVPDISFNSTLFSSSSHYVQSKRYVYKEPGVKLARSAILIEEVVIGSGSVVGDQSSVSHSTIGKSVSIGAHALIEHSHLWDNVIVEDNVQIHGAILGQNVVVKEGCVIPRGCIVAANVVIERAMMPLSDYARLGVSRETGLAIVWEADKCSSNDQYASNSDSEDSYSSNKQTQRMKDEAIRAVRMASIGCVEEESWKKSLWSQMPLPEVDEDDGKDSDEGSDLNKSDSEESDEETDQIGLAASTSDNEATDPTIHIPRAMGDSSDSEAENERKLSKSASIKSPRSPVPARTSSNSGKSGWLGANDRFTQHVMELMASGLTESHLPSSAILMEIKSLKFSHNTSFGDCVRASMLGVLTSPKLAGVASVKEMVLKIKEVFAEGSFAQDILLALKQNVHEE
jgi:translation initiation factor eIF-2B subunit epsilon